METQGCIDFSKGVPDRNSRVWGQYKHVEPSQTKKTSGPDSPELLTGVLLLPVKVHVSVGNWQYPLVTLFSTDQICFR